MQVVSLSAEPQGKPKNTGVGSLTLLQGILPTQEANWGLLHCRWIIYQLSYQGSPMQGSYDRLHSHPAFYLLLFLSFINFYFYFIHKVLLLVLFQTANSLLYLHFPFLFLLSVITVFLPEFPLMFLLV